MTVHASGAGAADAGPIPSRVLVADHYPTTVIHDELTDHASLLSSAKAEALLGFRPRHSWRSYRLETA
jgi:hypothetical protein